MEELEEKLKKEKELNEVYKQRLEMMKEIYRLEQGNNKLNLPSKLSSNYSNIPSNRLNEEKIKNEGQCYIIIEDRQTQYRENSCSCCINCKDCFSYFFIYLCAFITSIILSVICIIANIATIAYLFTIGWMVILMNNCEHSDDEDLEKVFAASPRLCLVSPWKWQCSILHEIIDRDKKENK